MELALFNRTKQVYDSEDLALLFMETEIGRFDYANNWQSRKAKGDIRKEIQDWLDSIHVDGNPDEIIEYLNELVEKRAGHWR